jgi:ribosomal protein S18 acetylase RimI-like enzyme
MGTLIRRVEAGDLPRIGQLHSDVWTELYSALLPPTIIDSLDPATMAALWSKFMTRGPEYVQHVALVNDEIAGFIGVGPGRDPGYELGRELYFLVVAPEHRRTSVGKALLKQADVDIIWVAESNRSAQAFYRKQKYFPDSVARTGSLFGVPLPELRMAR